MAVPVVCDPVEAARILEEARIDEVRAPVTHPQLLPGLARAAQAAPALDDALAALCVDDAQLSVTRGDSWSDGRSAAYLIRVTQTTDEGCSLIQQRVTFSIGIGDQGVRYTLFDRSPPERTPLDGCDEPPVWRTQRILAGHGADVRLVLVVDRHDAVIVDSAIEAWRASDSGWVRQVLIHPAPPRHLDPQGAGPLFRLGHTDEGETLAVASLDRRMQPCRPGRGQTVWTWGDDAWIAHTGRDALTLLAREGLWRLAGDPGWFLILAQDDASDARLLRPRMRRLQRRSAEALHLFRSSDFPGFNPGYLFISPGPWPTRAEAEAALGRMRRGAYVKAGWRAPSPCTKEQP